MTPAAVFRCDGSITLGAGHVMRCLALAATLRSEGWETFFITVAQSLELVPLLRGEDCFLIDGDDEDDGKIARRFAGKTNWLVVDHRSLGQTFEERSRSWARYILVIEDSPDRAHECDLLLDQTAGREAQEYAGAVPAHCRVVTGGAYVLLREEFTEARRRLARTFDRGKGGSRVLLSFGATDPYGLTARLATELLRQDKDVQLDIVCGASAPDAIASTAAQNPARVSVHVAVGDMAPLMLKADLGVGVGGVTAWERCALGLPSAMFIPNEYHRSFVEKLSALGAGAIVGDYRDLSIERSSGEILSLLHDSARLKNISDAALVLCDGEGAKRVVHEMSAIMTGQLRHGMRTP